MTFDDIALDPLTLRAADRIHEQLTALTDEVPKGREHWAIALRAFLRIFTAQTTMADPAVLRVEDILEDKDRAALAKLKPELDGLLSRVWHHGQWKLGELAAWQRVWAHLRHVHETLTQEVDDAAT